MKKSDKRAFDQWAPLAFAAQLESRYRRVMALKLRKAGFDLSVREWHALAYVASCRAEQLSVTARWPPTRAGVMRALDLDKAAASRLVAGLIRKEYLAELRSRPFDARMKALVPAIRGRTRLASLLKIEDAVMQELLSSAGASAAKDLQTALKTMGRAFQNVELPAWKNVAKGDV